MVPFHLEDAALEREEEAIEFCHSRQFIAPPLSRDAHTALQEHGREKSKNTSEEEGVPEEPPSAEAIARENFGDEEDENENDEDEEDDEETYDEDEGFDIDDLSSENPTAASSPVVIPSDPPVERIPTLSRPPSADKDLTTMAALQDEQDRFQDPLPKPRRLSARHSQSPFKTHIPEPTPSRTLPNNSAASPRLTASTTRRRERGEEGDRDFINESLDFKRGVGGAGRRKALGKGQRAPSTRQQSESDPVGCFAVVGCDDFDSASQVSIIVLYSELSTDAVTVERQRAMSGLLVLYHFCGKLQFRIRFSRYMLH